MAKTGWWLQLAGGICVSLTPPHSEYSARGTMPGYPLAKMHRWSQVCAKRCCSAPGRVCARLPRRGCQGAPPPVGHCLQVALSPRYALLDYGIRADWCGAPCALLPYLPPMDRCPGGPAGHCSPPLRERLLAALPMGTALMVSMPLRKFTSSHRTSYPRGAAHCGWWRRGLRPADA